MVNLLRSITPPLGFGKFCPHRTACKVYLLSPIVLSLLYTCLIHVLSSLPHVSVTFSVIIIIITLSRSSSCSVYHPCFCCCFIQRTYQTSRCNHIDEKDLTTTRFRQALPPSSGLQGIRIVDEPAFRFAYVRNFIASRSAPIHDRRESDR